MAAVMMAYPPRDSFQGYPQQYAVFQTRAHQAQSSIAQSLAINPYANYAPVAETQQYVPMQSSSHQATQLAVGDDGSRPSLPSISNLLDLADGDRTNQDGTQQQPQVQVPNTHQYAPQASRSIQPEQRQQPSYAVQDYQPAQQRMATIPPTPPLRNDSVVEGTNSPSTISTGSSLSIAQQPYYIGGALNNIEATNQRSVTNNQFIKRHSLPSQPNISPYGTYTTSPYTTHSPGATSTGSYYSPPDPTPFYPSQQRPLPSNFPPQPPSSTPHPHHHPSSPPKLWAHHHYINASSTASFPQSPDRYICPTCAKAFSRPSSLKIHTHSHTGEKPFKCPRAGCGKSFSVRSNMKRHERGCHGVGSCGGGGVGVRGGL